MLDGFIGFFEAKLYKDVVLSTLPSTHTPDMYSWFPYFFPLKVSFYILSSSIELMVDLLAGLFVAVLVICLAFTPKK